MSTSETAGTVLSENEISEDRLNGADVCPACLAELVDGGGFCPACHAPVNPTAAISPFESVFAEGYIYRRAVETPRSGVALWGSLLLWSLALLGGLGVILMTIKDGLLEPVMVLQGGFGIGSLGLYHTLRNYRRRQSLAVAANHA